MPNGQFGQISATANLGVRELYNPLPFNLTDHSIYFKSDADVSMALLGWDPMAGAWNTNVNYQTSSGWLLIAGIGTPYNVGEMYSIRNIKCSDPLGCLFQFANDSAGQKIIGEAYIAPNHDYISSSLDGIYRYPQTTYSVSKGEVQFSPDDPMNRDFREILSISGKGYLGDRFNVYTDPDALIRIDNLSAGACITCATDADCPMGITCVAGLCKIDTCRVAMHPSGPPCPPSFVCPRIDTSALNETLEVSSTKDHSVNATTVTIVGTRANDPNFGLISDSATLTVGPNTPVSFGNDKFSGVYIIKVVDGLKGETLTFTTGQTLTDVATLYLPTSNYTTKSSIGSIEPQPRRLMITSDNPTAGRVIHYKIKGMKGDTQVVEEENSKATQVSCSLTGPAPVNPDPALSGCTLNFSTIGNQAVGVPFKVRITAVSTGPPPPPQPNGCASNNPACPAPYVCIGNTCQNPPPTLQPVSYPWTQTGSVGGTCGGSNAPFRLLGPPDAFGMCVAWQSLVIPQHLDSFIVADNTIDIGGVNTTMRSWDQLGHTLIIKVSNDPNCRTDSSLSTFTEYGRFTPSTIAQTPKDYVVYNGVANVKCISYDISPHTSGEYYVDAIGVFQITPQLPVPAGCTYSNPVCPVGTTCVANTCQAAGPPAANCNSFNGAVRLWDSLGMMCPQSAGPFYHGVWSGSVIVPAAGNDRITAFNPEGAGVSGQSNQFLVSAVTGASSASLITNEQFTHVLSIEIGGNGDDTQENEHFNITTAPLSIDYPGTTDQVPEQIGVIDVVPNDFTVGSHQNKSGTYLYSQQDSINLNIPDNNSLGLHNFQFRFYDRFNNTFIVPYTIWLRQPTSILLTITTQRNAVDLDRTDVTVDAQLLYQRFDKPEEKPNTPIGAGYNISLYVQNSSDSAYDPTGCHPLTAVCPIAPEISNCSCPDWIDDPSSPGDCIPFVPQCRQFGWLPNATGGSIFPTDANGMVHTSFSIWGFGRRMMFAVFNGTREYAPAIQIQPFYAGGMNIGMGKFSVLEPLLLVAAALGLLAVKRKFNKQKNE